MNATVEAVSLPRERALKLIMFCGWHAAGDWDNEKLGAKLGELTTVYEPGKDATPDDVQTAEDLATVIAGIEAGASFEVVGEAEASDFFEDAKNVGKKPRKKREKKEGDTNAKKGPSNKEVIYKIFEKDPTIGADAVEGLVAAVNGVVKDTTVRSWIAQWKHGKNLPSYAKKKQNSE